MFSRLPPPPSAGSCRRVRDAGDAWAIGPGGRRCWGRFGAAGLLCIDGRKGLLMQHRASWSDCGGTWGIPGGARKQGEPARNAALREAAEEAGVPEDAVRLFGSYVLDLGFWSYVTVFAEPLRDFPATRCDAESIELRWVPLDNVTELPLHPEFGRSWPAVRDEFARAVRT